LDIAFIRAWPWRDSTDEKRRRNQRKNEEKKTV